MPHLKSLTYTDQRSPCTNAPGKPQALRGFATGEDLARTPPGATGTWPSLGTIYLQRAPSWSPAAPQDGSSASVKEKWIKNCHAFKIALQSPYCNQNNRSGCTVRGVVAVSRTGFPTQCSRGHCRGYSQPRLAPALLFSCRLLLSFLAASSPASLPGDPSRWQAAAPGSRPRALRCRPLPGTASGQRGKAELPDCSWHRGWQGIFLPQLAGEML